MIWAVPMGLVGGIIAGLFFIDLSSKWSSKISQEKADAFATLLGAPSKEERAKLDAEYKRRTSSDPSIHSEL